MYCLTSNSSEKHYFMGKEFGSKYLGYISWTNNGDGNRLYRVFSANDKKSLNARAYSLSDAKKLLAWATYQQPQFLTNRQIMEEAERIEFKISEICQKMIAQGRGYEKHSETVKLADSLSVSYTNLTERNHCLQHEAEHWRGVSFIRHLPEKGKARQKFSQTAE
jgi:hypothetical protein